jgi:hypothetical protein
MRHMTSKMSILTSANLVTCHGGETMMADNLKVSAACRIHLLLIYVFFLLHKVI